MSNHLIKQKMLRSSVTGYRVSSELLLMKMKRGERRRRKQNDQNIPNNRHQAGSIFFLLTTASGPFLSVYEYEFISQMFLELNICL